ncbi:hypothetical protein BJF83_06950 [Nocardiopsis sp. CNR-923]|nr:hypothetical protein BJF83_06950 [Nocardiopsis sp. CNR-923]
MRAGVAQAISIHRRLLMCPSTTAWCSRSIRFSTPGMPLGILEKSPTPRSFCPVKQNGQWSVETTDRSFVRSARHRSSWCSLGRSGVEHTYLAPSNPGSARLSVDRNRYCGQVSPNTLSPLSRARASSSTASPADTCTTYNGAPATRASWIARWVASDSSRALRTSPW